MDRIQICVTVVIGIVFLQCQTGKAVVCYVVSVSVTLGLSQNIKRMYMYNYACVTVDVTPLLHAILYRRVL